jgi:hypothetical protein
LPRQKPEIQVNPRAEFARRISKFMVVTGVAAAFFLGLVVLLNTYAGMRIDPNWTYPFSFTTGGVAFYYEKALTIKYRQFTVRSIDPATSWGLSKAYTIGGVIMMVAPAYLVFRTPVLTLQGTLVLSYLISSGFFMQKFIDMVVLGRPNLLQNHAMIWGFLAVSLVQFIFDSSSPLASASDANAASFLFLLFLLFYGVASVSIVQEKDEELEDKHPQYYLSLMHQGLYSLVLVMGLLFVQVLGIAERSPGLAWVSLVAALGVVVVMSPVLRQYARLRRFMGDLVKRKTKEDRKYFSRVQRDRWQEDVSRSFRPAGLAANLSLAISVAALYVGLATLVFGVESAGLGTAIQGVLVAYMAIMGVQYGLRRRGVPYQYSQAMKRLNLWRAESAEQLKNSFGLLSKFYFGLVTVLFGASRLSSLSAGLETQIYVMILIAVVLGAVAYWIQVNSFDASGYESSYLRRMRNWLNVLSFPIWGIIGGATGIVAVQYQVPAIIDSFSVAAIVLGLIGVQTYFSYIKGRGIKRRPLGS